ncbi:MAG: hypothetical protein WDM89_10335 [Rhizomicrobium sp.]
MAFEADIEIAAIVAFQHEPVDEFVVDLAGFQRIEHLHPGPGEMIFARRSSPRRTASMRARWNVSSSFVLSSSVLRRWCARRSNGAVRRLRPRLSSRAASMTSWPSGTVSASSE